MANEDDEKPGKDFIMLGPHDENGATNFIRHKPDHSIETGVMKELKDGESINPDNEIVRLTQNESDGLYDVEVLCERKGPSKVATTAYRSNWDKIWGKTDLPN